MRTTYKIHVMFLQKSRDDVRSKGERNTSVVFAPAGYIFVGIRPQKIAKEAAVGNLISQRVNV